MISGATVLALLSSTNDARNATADLDSALAATVQSAGTQADGPHLSGWIRSRFAWSSDVDVSGDPGEQDLAGFNLDDVRLIFSGSAAPGWNYTISADAGDPAISDVTGAGQFGLLDAYVALALCDNAAVSMGRFSATFLWSAGIAENRHLFLDKSFLGEATDGRDVGVEFSGWSGPWNAWAAVQNGADSVGNDFALSARVSFRVFGDELPAQDGCCGLGDKQNLTIGVGWFDDANLDNGTAICADVFFAQGPWSASAELVDFDDDLRIDPLLNTKTGHMIPSAASPTGAQTPWNASLAYMFVPDQWEAGARYENIDDDADTSVLTAAVTRYVAQHSIKWTAQYDHSDSDTSTLEADTISLGLTVGF